MMNIYIYIQYVREPPSGLQHTHTLTRKPPENKTAYSADYTTLGSSPLRAPIAEQIRQWKHLANNNVDKRRTHAYVICAQHSYTRDWPLGSWRGTWITALLSQSHTLLPIIQSKHRSE